MSNTQTVHVSVNDGIGPTLLFIAFLVLKLTGVISWSWFWVTAPIWIPAAFAGGFLLGAIAFVATRRRR